MILWCPYIHLGFQTRPNAILLWVFLDAFSSCSKWGLLSSWGALASHCGGLSCCRAAAHGARTSAVVVHRFSCPEARGIFPDQGSNLCPLLWQAGSYPLDHHGSLPLYINDTSLKFDSSPYHWQIAMDWSGLVVTQLYQICLQYLCSS